MSKKQKLNTGEHKYRFFSYQPTVNAATKIKNLIANSDDLNILQQTKQMINARLSTASITLDEYEETKEQLSLVNNRIDQLTSMDNQTKSI